MVYCLPIEEVIHVAQNSADPASPRRNGKCRTCHLSSQLRASRLLRMRKATPSSRIKFSQTDCKACPGRTSCTGQTRRTLTLQPQDKMQALLAARKRESTETFKETYRHRADTLGTHSQATRTMGLRRSRYFGLPKTHLGHVAIATAINLVHLMSWLRGGAPAQTRISPFKQVMQPAA